MDLIKPKISINGTKYTIDKQIGEGAYAYVYRVKEARILSSVRVLGSKELDQHRVNRLESIYQHHFLVNSAGMTI